MLFELQRALGTQHFMQLTQLRTYVTIGIYDVYFSRHFMRTAHSQIIIEIHSRL